MGLMWGIVARLWMAFLADVPEFTISGTGVILGISVVFSAAAGLAYGARRSGATGSRHYGSRAMAVVLFVAFAAQGGALVGLSDSTTGYRAHPADFA